MNGSRLMAIGLRKNYRQRLVVRGVDIDVGQGEIVGLLGPNGAGKTTSFYMIAGLVRPDSGRVLIGEKDVTALPVYRRAREGIGYLPQEASVFRDLTVRENLELACQEIGRNKKKNIRASAASGEIFPKNAMETPVESPVENLAENLVESSVESPAENSVKSSIESSAKSSIEGPIESSVESLMERFGIAHIADTRGYALSGGERRRVEIARLMPLRPNFILLDEPFSGIDPIAVSDIQAMIQELRLQGFGILLTDHNVRETLSITDRTYLIHDGRIILEGAPGEMMNNPLARKFYLGAGFEW